MSVIDDLKTIAENMPAVYAAGQLAGDSAEVAALSEKMSKIPFGDGEKTALTGVTRGSTKIDAEGTLNGMVSDYTLYAFSITANKKYLVTGTGDSNANTIGLYTAPLLVFTDENNAVLGYVLGTENASATYVEAYEVIAPDGAVNMFVNHLTTHEAVSVLEVAEKFEADVEDLSENIQTLLNSKGINFNHIWYANQNAVAKVSNPLVKVGGIEDFKIVGNGFVVMAASSVVLNGIIPSADSTVTPSVVVGGYDLFNNGDLLVYAGDFSNYEKLLEIFGGEADIWKRIPMHEAKTNLDGLMSAWDKTQVNKIPEIVEGLATKLPVYTNNAHKCNELFNDGVYVGGFLADCEGHPPYTGGNSTNWVMAVFNNYANSTNPNNHRVQIAIDLSNHLVYFRKGWCSNNSWADTWTDMNGGTTETTSDVLIVTDDDIDGSVAVANVTTDIKEVVVQSSVQANIHLPESAYNYWRCIINLTGMSVNCYYSGGNNDGTLAAGKTYLYVYANDMGNVYEVDSIYHTPITT